MSVRSRLSLIADQEGLLVLGGMLQRMEGETVDCHKAVEKGILKTYKKWVF